MPLYLHDGKLLINDSKLTISEDCCCPTCSDCLDTLLDESSFTVSYASTQVAYIVSPPLENDTVSWSTTVSYYGESGQAYQYRGTVYINGNPFGVSMWLQCSGPDTLQVTLSGPGETFFGSTHTGVQTYDTSASCPTSGTAETSSPVANPPTYQDAEGDWTWS